MKTLKFAQHLIPQILSGQKTSTFRLFDDKNLTAGEDVVFLNKETGETVGVAHITDVRCKTLGTLDTDDWTGHDAYISTEDMYADFRKYYGDQVNENTEVKIISFSLTTNI